MASTDRLILKSIINTFDSFNKYVEDNVNCPENLKHPLDKEIQGIVNDLTSIEDDEYAIFKKINDVKDLWKKLVEKSIICLRYYDTREPFLDNPNKNPQAYGIEKLNDYFDSYSEFESMLYGGSKYYRDHVVHVFRVWLLGIETLLKEDCKYLKSIKVTDSDTENVLEKLAIWTLIALTHDLGYPLEKALEIIDKTKGMMKSFVVDPVVSMDLSFTGVQNSMNDYVLRFMSSKMVKKIETVTADNEIEKSITEVSESEKTNEKDEEKEEKKDYVARLQPKYYFKFQKALEHYEHGVISALIIYKLLIYFLESDYSINEDYYFGDEDCRQFYIRREILRAVASHTCHDIYQQDAFGFSFLLILCDDAQEWGRKYLSELYVDKGEKYAYRGIEFGSEKAMVNGKERDILVCTLADKYELDTTSAIENVLKRFREQSKTYRDVFRDGQDTKNRNFKFVRVLKIDVKKLTPKEFTVTLTVSVNEQTSITAKREDSGKLSTSEEFYNAFNSVFSGSESCDDGKLLQYKL